MYVALKLETILENKEETKKLTGMPIKVICQMTDSMTVEDHIWLEKAGLKMEYTVFKKTGNPILDNGMIAGSLSALGTDGILITEDETLLRTERIEFGKSSLLFVGTLMDAIEAYRSAAKKQTTRKRRTVQPVAPIKEEEEKTTILNESETAKAALEEEKESIENEAKRAEAPTPFINVPEEEAEKTANDLTGEPSRDMTESSDQKEEEAEHALDEKDGIAPAVMEEANDESQGEGTENTETEEKAEEDCEATTGVVNNGEQAYDQSDRANAKRYPDDFANGDIQSPAYDKFKKLATSYGAKWALCPYVLTVFQLSDSDSTFFYRLNEVITDSNEANDLYLSLAEHYDELKKLADAVEPIDAYI